MADSIVCAIDPTGVPSDRGICDWAKRPMAGNISGDRLVIRDYNFQTYNWNGTDWVNPMYSSDGSGLVGQGGMVYAHDGYKKPGVTIGGVSSFGVLDQLSTGEYLCIDTENGDYARKLLLFSGDPITKVGTIITMPLTSVTAGNALLSSTGATVTFNAATKIVNAWATSNGDIYYLSFDTTLHNYLWRAKAGTYTVGSDAGYSNKRACIDVGLHGGVHSTNIRSLSHRTFLEAKVGGVSHLYFCEYNVNGARTGGSGGFQKRNNKRCYRINPK